MPPTVDLSGPAAADVTAPELTVTAVGTGEDRRYAVSATDDGPGAIDVGVDRRPGSPLRRTVQRPGGHDDDPGVRHRRGRQPVPR